MYSFIQQLENQFPVRMLCKTFQISPSAYYAWKAGDSYQPAQAEHQEIAQVKEAFQVHKRRYGTRRLATELGEMGLNIGRKKIRRIMKQQELVAIQPKSFVPRTTDSRHGKLVAPNLLLEAAASDGPNQIWVGDITYIPLVNSQWAYLATWLDVYSQMLVGWQLDDNMEESLIISALNRGLQWRAPAVGMIVHSDRGGQYVGDAFGEFAQKAWLPSKHEPGR